MLKWIQKWSKWQPNGLQMPATSIPGGLRMGQEASKWFKRCQDGLNEAPRPPQGFPRWPQDVPTFIKYVDLCKSYVPPNMILNLKFDAKMEPKSCWNESKMIKVAAKWTPNARQIHPWRSPNGPGGFKMVQEVPRWLQWGSKSSPRWPQLDSKSSPKPRRWTNVVPRWLIWTPTWSQEWPRWPQRDPMWPQDGPKMAPRGFKRGQIGSQNGI